MQVPQSTGRAFLSCIQNFNIITGLSDTCTLCMESWALHDNNERNELRSRTSRQLFLRDFLVPKLAVCNVILFNSMYVRYGNFELTGTP